MDNKKMTSLQRKHGLLRTSWLTAAVVVLLLGSMAIQAEGAIFKVDPSLILSEEYNDNVFLRGQGNERIYAYITRIAPSLTAKYTTSFWDWDVIYTYDYYYYFYKTHQYKQEDQTHTLNLRNKTEVLKDLFFIELRDTYNRVSQSAAVDYTQQSPTANQVDQNIFLVNPYLVLRPSLSSRIIPGYIFQTTRYYNTSVDTNAANVNHQTNMYYGDAGMDLSTRLTVTAGARYTQDKNTDLSYNALEAYAGPRYTYAENAYVYARGGKIWFDFAHDLYPRQDYWFWDAGLNHRVSTLTFNLNTRRSIVQDPIRAVTMEDQYTASISYTQPRSVLTLGAGWNEYRDAVLDERISKTQQIQASLLYRLSPTFTSTVGTSVQNVEDYIKPDGLTVLAPTIYVTRILLSTFRLDYLLSDKATLSFEYRYTNTHSHAKESGNNYFNNRYIVEYRQILPGL
jgi:hypothetical protein